MIIKRMFLGSCRFSILDKWIIYMLSTLHIVISVYVALHHLLQLIQTATANHPQFRMSSGFMTRFSIIIIIYTLLINLWIGCLLTFLLLVISRLEKIPAWSSSWWEKEHHTGGSESYREERKRGKVKRRIKSMGKEVRGLFGMRVESMSQL